MIILEGKHKTGEVWFNGERLDIRESLKVRNHSPTGFAWGYGGSGPSQLALAVLLKAKEEGFIAGEITTRRYMEFKFKVIEQLPFDKDFKIEIDPNQL
jgi:hypothetical protein